MLYNVIGSWDVNTDCCADFRSFASALTRTSQITRIGSSAVSVREALRGGAIASCMDAPK